LEIRKSLRGRPVTLSLFVVFVALVVLLSTTRVFGALPPSITATPSTFGDGTTVTVSGSGFTGGMNVRVWFDTNGNGVPDFGEPLVHVKASSGGTFSTSLPVSGVPDGAYRIYASPGIPLTAPPIASTPVTVEDATILGSFTAALSSAVSTLESNLATQLASLQSDIDTHLGDIESTLTGIDNTVNSLPTADQVVQSYAQSGTCSLNPDNSLYYDAPPLACGFYHIATTGNTPWPEAVYTVTLSIESTGLEAGASLWIGTGSAKIDVASCTAGTCNLDGFTTTVASPSVAIWASCGGPTDSCDTPIVVDYTIVAVGSTSGQSLACDNFDNDVFC